MIIHFVIIILWPSIFKNFNVTQKRLFLRLIMWHILKRLKINRNIVNSIVSKGGVGEKHSVTKVDFQCIVVKNWRLHKRPSEINFWRYLILRFYHLTVVRKKSLIYRSCAKQVSFWVTKFKFRFTFQKYSNQTFS